MFCTDELKLKNYFTNNEEMVITSDNADGTASIIEAFYKKLDKLTSIANKGAAKMGEVYSYEREILPHAKILEYEIII